MQVIAKEFIHREEVSRVVAATKNAQTHTAPRGQGQIHHPKDNHRENGSKEKGILPKARPLKRRTHNAKNKSSFCDYHQGYGHKTQDCYNLKDAIKQAIRDGKLNEFIQIIREPRISDKERSPRPESRNPRFRQDNDEPVMKIVVITGSSATQKSKSALKKDLKILPTVRTPSTISNNYLLEKRFCAWHSRFQLNDGEFSQARTRFGSQNLGRRRGGFEHHVQECF
ncbi:hypothetical protein PIB30_060772 [Stylosanthes scabra]|uniref:Reverse transcriptase domain-containing protein n=1 Tax=Stylosanthes scabra TaxID=79078 RepID=A0ABU6QK37_9FABA|nr:hypothetical protein [Stylosanthes scabra]